MKTIYKNLSVKAFLDKENNPCCAKNFETGEICMFYRAAHFGTHETCVFAKDNYRGQPERLTRRGENEMGTLIPLENCPIWSVPEKIS